MNEKLLCVVDGNNIVMKAHHALFRQGFTTSSGVPTGALFGSIKSHISITRMLRPDYMIWFFDSGRSKARTEILESYKGSRNSKSDLTHQFSAFEKYLSLTNTRFYREQNVEADDLIAAAVKRWDPAVPKVIVSADHDLRQLVSSDPKVSVLKLKQGKSPQVAYTEKRVLSEYGLEPYRLSDVWAMSGDSGDEIPGVPKIGVKTAVKILQQHGTLEEALENEKKLQGYREVVERNKKLIHLDGSFASLPVGFDETVFHQDHYEKEALQEFFEEWEINSLRLKTKGPGLYA